MTSIATIEKELGRLRDDYIKDGSGVRTSISTMVVLAASDDRAQEAARAVAAMPGHRPSRAIVATTADGLTTVEAETSVYCTMPPDGSGSYVCSDLVELRGPADGAALRQMITSLLLPDLPMFLVWEAPPEFDRPLFLELSEESDRLITDAARFDGTLEALPALARRVKPILTDVAWTNITGWREVVASLFDLPDHAARLPALEAIHVRHAEGSTVQSRLLAGWIESRTGRDAETTFEAQGELPVPGAPVAIEIVCDGTTFGVERVDDGSVVTTSPGLPEQRRVLPVLTYADLLAGELEFVQRDAVFTDALGAATDLWR